MKVSLFDFELPPECIAQHPQEPRDTARLLHVQGDVLTDMTVRDLPSLLDERDMLVFNNTKVIPARLHGKRGDIAIEILLHRERATGLWQAFARPGKRLRIDDRVIFAEDFSAEIEEKLDNGEVLLRFDESGGDFLRKLERYGDVPLPPYIAREGKASAEDRERYQTLYAEREGAVAAPTAGLHFTDRLLREIEQRGAKKVFVTLHVGAGTFQPVKVEDTTQHVMHHEWGEISAETAEAINKHKAGGGRVVAVGTTSLRLLESASDEAGRLKPFLGETDIFITPGYRFRLVDRILTNFHLPKSTLFMLVSAFSGRETMLLAYRHAIENSYRFYSYGDTSLLEKAA